MTRPRLACPPDLDLTRPISDLVAEVGVSVAVLLRWRREAGVEIPRGRPIGSHLEVGRTRLLLLRLAGVDEVRELTTEERQRVRGLLGVSRQRLHAAWRDGVSRRTIATWSTISVDAPCA